MASSLCGSSFSYLDSRCVRFFCSRNGSSVFPSTLFYSFAETRSPGRCRVADGDDRDFLRSSRPRKRDVDLQLPELKTLLEALKAKREVERKGEEMGGSGCVFLVGAGPGDPELLTLKAVKVLQSADILLYDRLVSNDVLNLVNPDAKFLYVGKSAGYHSRTQSEIHEMLLNFAEVGATLVRLKGGDPLVFGRGGEEVDYLRRKGIEVKVIPGITAASGIAAELGIPLTHRGVANSVRFLTGHSRDGGTEPVFIEDGSAHHPDCTLVIYMGLSTLPSFSSKLITGGLPPHTPAVAVERGTTPQQRVVFAELQHLANRTTLMNFVSPTLSIVGNAVSLSPLWSKSTDSCPSTVLLPQYLQSGTCFP